MTERPILFNAEMVLAILDGRKTQTRRVVKIDEKGRFVIGRGRGYQTVAEMTDAGPSWRPYGGAPLQPMPKDEYAEGCPYGRPGDLLWVRETWRPAGFTASTSDYIDQLVEYAARGPGDWEEKRRPPRGKAPRGIRPGSKSVWRPSIHMPRWASRLTLRVTDVRVERVQEINRSEAVAEGCAGDERLQTIPGGYPAEVVGTCPVAEFADLWESINAKRGNGWDVNPWCWVVSFERVLP